MPESLAALQEPPLRTTPDDIDRWIDLCEAAEKAGYYAVVLQAGDQIVRIAPEQPQPHFIRGLALHRLDRIEEAIEAYKRVLEFNPGYLDALINLGECCQFLNRLDEAEAFIAKRLRSAGRRLLVTITDRITGIWRWSNC